MCGSSKWKREFVPDHRFDVINTREFYDSGFFMRIKYLWLYLVVLKSFLVYVSDIFSAVTMLTTKNWSNEIFKQCQDINGCVFIPFTIGKWLFVSCILVGFLLLAYESRKAKKVIRCRDVSYAFTNILAHDYYSLRSYDHFCFFERISSSTKLSDDFAFFVFFTFKSWKRLLLADAPRQAINALTLYAVYLVKKDNPGSWYDVRKYFKDNSNSTSALTVSSFFTVAVCAGSMLLLFVAAVCYIPLLFHIRGNLKEYCCHKVDKRIREILKMKQKERAKLDKKEAMGDYSHLKNKKGELIAKPLPQPTLPKLTVDDDDSSSVATRVPPSNASTYNHTQDYYYNAEKSMDYPPMPAFNPYSHHPAPGAPSYNPSFGHEDQYNYPSSRPYDDDSDSIAKLRPSPLPFSHDPMDRQGSPYVTPSTQGNRSDVYQGHPYSPAPSQTRHAMPPPIEHERQPSSGSSVGLAYDEGYSNDHQTQPTHPVQPSGYVNSPRGGRNNYQGGYAT